MKVLAGLPNNDLNAIAGYVQDIEASGYDGVTITENAHNPFLPLAVAAVNTDRITLQTGVAIAFPRSPMMIANMAWDLQSATGGRFVLGLGSQIKPHIERRYSTKWSAPAPRMREYIGAVRAIFSSWHTGERLNFEGQHYNFTLMTPNFVPKALTSPPPPIHISAVGPNMLRLAGEACDGVMLHPFCSRDYITNQILPRLEEGMARTGRKRADFVISGGGFVCTGATDEEVSEMVEWTRTRIGFYGSTKAYWPVLQENGLEDLGQRLLHLSRNDGWTQMAAEVTDDVVRLFAAVGRHDELVAAVTERFGGVTDSIDASASLAQTGGLPPDLLTDLQAIPAGASGITT